MTPDLANDRRLDPRLRTLLQAFPTQGPGDVADREELLAEANTPEAVAAREAFRVVQDMCDTEEAAPSAGLTVRTVSFRSEPDGNTVQLQVIRPDTEDALPGVYYIHGGGMASMSCFDGMYRGWGKHIAANGVAVVMVDFRNCVTPSSAPEVAPFPAGLHDCVSGLRWVAAHTAELGIDAARLVVAGESGGGNLTLATGLQLNRDGDLGLVKGLYACAPTSPAAGLRRTARRRSRTRASCCACTTTGAPSAMASRPSRHAIPWPGRPSPPSTTSGASRPPSSTSTSATRCATRASTSTASSSRRASRRGAAR